MILIQVGTQYKWISLLTFHHPVMIIQYTLLGALAPSVFWEHFGFSYCCGDPGLISNLLFTLQICSIILIRLIAYSSLGSLLWLCPQLFWERLDIPNLSIFDRSFFFSEDGLRKARKHLPPSLLHMHRLLVQAKDPSGIQWHVQKDHHLTSVLKVGWAVHFFNCFLKKSSERRKYVKGNYI